MTLPDISVLPDWLQAVVVMAFMSVMLYGGFVGARKTLKDAKATGAKSETVAGTPVDLSEPFKILVNRVTRLEEADESKSKKISELRREQDHLRATVRRLVGVLTREVAHVVQWISSGANPPSPDSELEVIQSVINDLKDSSER